VYLYLRIKIVWHLKFILFPEKIQVLSNPETIAKFYECWFSDIDGRLLELNEVCGETHTCLD